MTLTITEVLEQVENQGGIDAALRVFERFPVHAGKTNSLTPWTGEIPPLGTWKLDPFLSEFSVLTELPLADVEPLEPEGDIKCWPGYPLYVQWARDGLQLPPISVIRNKKGQLRSLNRRRVLAAKDAGLRTILAWLSESDENGQPLWQWERQYKVWFTNQGKRERARYYTLEQAIEGADFLRFQGAKRISIRDPFDRVVRP